MQESFSVSASKEEDIKILGRLNRIHNRLRDLAQVKFNKAPSSESGWHKARTLKEIISHPDLYKDVFKIPDEDFERFITEDIIM